MKKLIVLLLLSVFLLAACGADWIVNRHQDIMEETDNFGNGDEDVEG